MRESLAQIISQPKVFTADIVWVLVIIIVGYYFRRTYPIYYSWIIASIYMFFAVLYQYFN